MYSASITSDLAETHMLHAVSGIEHARDHATPGMIERAEEHRFALLLNVTGLRQKRRLIDCAFVQRPGVFGHPQRGE